MADRYVSVPVTLSDLESDMMVKIFRKRSCRLNSVEAGKGYCVVVCTL